MLLAIYILVGNFRIQIHTDPISLSGISVLDDEPAIKPVADSFVLNDVEELF